MLLGYVSIYLVFALVVYLVSIIAANSMVEKNQARFVVGVLIVCNALIAALRPEGTQDTDFYISLYADLPQYLSSIQINGIGDIFANRSIQSIELGYVLFMAVFRGMFEDPSAFFFVQGIASNVLSMYGIFALCLFAQEISTREESDRLFCRCIIPIFGFYLLYCGILYTSSAIRDGLSIALGLAGLGALLLGRRKALAVLSLVLSILFHTTSVLFVVLFPVLKLCKIRMSKNRVAAFSVTAIVAYFLGLGQYTVNLFATIFSVLLGILGIGAFGSYLANLDFQLPLREGFLVFSIALALTIGYQKRNVRTDVCSIIVILGMYMMVLAYPIPAIVRLFYIFGIFVIPVLANADRRRNAVWCVSILMLIPQAVYVFGYLQF